MTGHPRFFLGSDSAPHSVSTKSTSKATQGCAAGIYTSPILLPLLAHLLESFGALHNLEGFASTFGRRFYGLEVSQDYQVVQLRKRQGLKVQDAWQFKDQSVVPFMAGREINWEIIRCG